MEQRMHFNNVAEMYDEYRPSYPELMYNDILSISKLNNQSKVLDIGCGTGKSTDYFIRNHFNVIGIDPAIEMLTVCKNKYKNFPNFRIIQSDFEKWNFEQEKFDLIISGTAFHWVSLNGNLKLYNLSNKHGYVCIFWHTFMNGDNPIFKEFDILYKKYAPELWVDDINTFQEITDLNKVQSIITWPGFTNWRSMNYRENYLYDTKAYINLLKTWSTHLNLSDAFYTEVKKLLDNYDGKLSKPIKTTVCIGEKT